MAHTGEMIENPVTHDRVIFRVTAQYTHDKFLEFDDFLLAGYMSPPEHVHLMTSHERLSLSFT